MWEQSLGYVSWRRNDHRDPGEKKNLLAGRESDVKKLKRLLADWEKEVRPTR
ncbi:hypothetical protein HQ563_00225 [bacterium]|nr:hypothetical protein [bacterium]